MPSTTPIERRKILVIEDEEATFTPLIETLKKGGFTVFHANNGAAGLLLAEKEKPEVIILDIILPGLSGIDVLATLKKNEATRSIPVLILSQVSDADTISRGIALGALGYLVKSEYQLFDILDKLKTILKR